GTGPAPTLGQSLQDQRVPSENSRSRYTAHLKARRQGFSDIGAPVALPKGGIFVCRRPKAAVKVSCREFLDRRSSDAQIARAPQFDPPPGIHALPVPQSNPPAVPISYLCGEIPREAALPEPECVKNLEPRYTFPPGASGEPLRRSR